MAAIRKNDHLAWVEIDLKALRNNYKAIKGLARRQFVKNVIQEKVSPKVRNTPEILAVIKADAYGHGMLKAASLLAKLKVGYLGVSDVAEGIALRKSGIKKPILLFESTLPSAAKQIIDHNLTPTICTHSLAAALNKYAKSINKKIDVHVSVDTGMGRLGIWHEEAEDFIRRVMRSSYLSIKGIYTHFPIADTNPRFTKYQVKLLYDLVRKLDQQAAIVPYIHAANSMGLARYKTHILNLSRPGLMLYGLSPSVQLKKKIKLNPVMSVKTRVIFAKFVKKGRGVSYGHTFIAKKDMTVATLPIGYNDGFFRCLSNKAEVLIDGKRCLVVGRVTMDQIMVDASKVKSVRLGAEAVIVGKQKKACISADELADKAGTINYEIVCSLGNRLPRVYK